MTWKKNTYIKEKLIYNCSTHHTYKISCVFLNQLKIYKIWQYMLISVGIRTAKKIQRKNNSEYIVVVRKSKKILIHTVFLNTIALLVLFNSRINKWLCDARAEIIHKWQQLIQLELELLMRNHLQYCLLSSSLLFIPMSGVHHCLVRTACCKQSRTLCARLYALSCCNKQQNMNCDYQANLSAYAAVACSAYVEENESAIASKQTILLLYRMTSQCLNISYPISVLKLNVTSLNNGKRNNHFQKSKHSDFLRSAVINI